MSSFGNWNSQGFDRSAKNNFGSLYDNSDKLHNNHHNHTKKNKSMLGKSRKEFHDPLEYEENVKCTTGRLFSNNFNHHDPNLCVCDSCNCGRHFCKLHNVKPDLSKSSNYHQSYPKKTPVPNVINRAGEYQKLKGDHIGMDSSYKKSFLGNRGDPNEKPRPEDLLKTGGPSQKLTSYSNGFPGYKGSNQYVKPTDNMIRADFPLRAKSTYAKSFQNRTAPKPITQKIPDNLKTSKLWMGKTTYGSLFGQPNPEDYAKRSKNVEKLQINPKYSHQYQTTYGHSFIPNQSSVCPAKKILESKAKGLYNSTKDRFTQNSDFKSLNPAFHSISTSKHCYV